VNKGDQGKGIWLMGFIYLYEIGQRNLTVALSGVRRAEGRVGGDDLTNVQM
jgi:hypothetical protein